MSELTHFDSAVVSLRERSIAGEGIPATSRRVRSGESG
jgi:hypothetical protein